MITAKVEVREEAIIPLLEQLDLSKLGNKELSELEIEIELKANSIKAEWARRKVREIRNGRQQNYRY